jgi:hypothetical protein
MYLIVNFNQKSSTSFICICKTLKTFFRLIDGDHRFTIPGIPIVNAPAPFLPALLLVVAFAKSLELH